MTATNGRLFRVRAAMRGFGPALLLLCGVAATAAAAGTSEAPAATTIEVSGSGTASAAPDIAVVRLGAENRSAQLQSAISATTKVMDSVTSAIESDGVAVKDIQTSEYNVHSEQQPASGTGSAPPPTEYVVDDVASVTIRDISRVGTIVTDALSAGANRVDAINFSLSDPDRLRAEARDAAFKDAESRAQQLAHLAGVTLGRVVKISESSGGVPEPYSNVRMAMTTAAPPVSAGAVQVSVTIDTVFAIEPK